VTRPAFRGVLGAALLFAGGAWANAAHARGVLDPCAGWPEWQHFKQLYLSEDGRVVDAGVQQGITVSEGQAYALTFAVIANDRAAFDRILRWTQDNLAGGNLEVALPAWKWGRAADGKWTVLDPNSASDADLWIAYALSEAARSWHAASYAHLAQAMAELIVREEVAWIPQLGATLLPGPKGFVSQQTWRLNASYSPIQVLRRIGKQTNNPLWAEVLQSSARVIIGSAPHGYAADWIDYRPAEGFVTDSATNGVGSYNAIRVYLWTGMLADGDPQAAVLASRLEPMATRAAQQPPPEQIDSNTLEVHGTAPPGFFAALLPLLAHFKHSAAVASYRKLVEGGALTDNQHYYSDVLSLFGLGWLDGRYQFDRQGRLQVRWNESCRAP
jgi:endo-1,4-beta-D-glucanase Y